MRRKRQSNSSKKSIGAGLTEVIRVYRIGSLSIIIVEFAIVYQFYHTHTWFDSTINNRSLNDSSVQAEGSYDDEEISPRKPPKKISLNLCFATLVKKRARLNYT